MDEGHMGNEGNYGNEKASVEGKTAVKGESAEKEFKPEPKKKTINELEVVSLLIIAILGRILLEPLPSVEPIIPIAVFAGLAYGGNAGILIGLLAYPISNFFMLGGPFGLWSVLQATGGAISGGLAGAKKLSVNNLLYYSFIGTIIFELLLNVGDGAFLVWPYSVTHIVSNLVIALIISLGIKEK